MVNPSLSRGFQQSLIIVVPGLIHVWSLIMKTILLAVQSPTQVKHTFWITFNSAKDPITFDFTIFVVLLFHKLALVYFQFFPLPLITLLFFFFNDGEQNFSGIIVPVYNCLLAIFKLVNHKFLVTPIYTQKKVKCK